MSVLKNAKQRRTFLLGVLFFAAAVAVFLLGLLAASIMERRGEALALSRPVLQLAAGEPRNSVWGASYQREYDSYLKNSETSFQSKYNGNAQIDMLERDPYLVVLWAGYPFAKDYWQARGHIFSIADIRRSLRTGAPRAENDGPMPNTCWTCKGADVPRVMSEMGVAAFYLGKWAALGAEIVNPVGCADCHDSRTMNLKITRPALGEAFQRLGQDVGALQFQEKRSLVCAQCHVEYYFQGEGKYLTFPWDKGLTVQAMEKYYDESSFADWTHLLSRAPMLKAQHPDYEIWRLGIHARRGLACADCHMPYVSEGGVKYSDHHVQSPLNTVNRSCQVCHRESEAELVRSVYDNQDRVQELQTLVEEALVRAHIEAKAAWEKGASAEEMRPVLPIIRHAQWRWDFAVAGHGAAAHAPVEVCRILGSALDLAGEARRLLSKILSAHGFLGEVPLPDLSSKEKAQRFVGLDMAALNAEKAMFLQTLLPRWDEKARQRENGWDSKKK